MLKTVYKVAIVSLACGWIGYAGPWQSPPPAPPEKEIQIVGACDMPEPPEPELVAPHALQTALDTTQWGVAALQPGFAAHLDRQPRTVSAISRILALMVPGVAMAASPPPLGGMPNYPVQPGLDVSWTLQGMAEDMAEGGEGADVVEYGG